MIHSDDTIDKYLFKNLISSSFIYICDFKIIDFFKNELNTNIDIDNLLNRLKFPITFRELKTIDENIIKVRIEGKHNLEDFYVFFKNILSNYKRYNSQLEFFKKYHPNQFLVEVEINHSDEKDYFSLQKKVLKFEIKDFSIIKPENVDIEDIEVSSSAIIKQLKTKYISFLETNLKNYGYFKKHFFLKNNKLNKDFNISDTLADFFPLFLETPWHLIDTGFSNKVGEKLSQYNPRMFYYTLGNDFCDTYNDYLVDFRMKIKKEIFEELKYITLDDILQENPFLKELYSVKFIIENNLPDLYDNNSDLYNQMLDFEKFSFEEKRHINKQREFHRKILNSFDNIEDILKLKIIDFVNKFDVSYDKKLVDKIKLNKDRYDYTIKELINSIDTHENHSLFLYPGSDFLQVFNAFGGYWLIMFDLIRIQKNQSETFDFYQTFLNKDKQSSLPYKKKFIHLLFLCSQFLNNKKLNIEELREFIDLKYSQSSREDIEDLEVFCKLFLSHEPYVSTIEELFLDYHI